MSSLFFHIDHTPTMRVMAFHAMGPTQKEDAAQLMQEWFLQQQLPEGHVPRIFSYYKKNPESGKGDFGYEMLITLPETGTFTPEVSVSVLDACSYACVSSDKPEWGFVRENLKQGPFYENVDNQWVATQAYGGFLNRQWLVEQHVVPESIAQFMLTSLTPFEYSGYTVMIPIAKTA